MRTISFIFAFAILFLGPSLAESSSTSTMPGIGTFDFGPPASTTAPVMMAALR